VLGAVLLALGAGYLFWLRDSSLVAVDDVDVVGVTAGEREQIVAELTAVAEQMTTLNVDRDRIERVAAGYPTIRSVSIDPNFPHGMRIEVAERPPTMLVRGGGREVPVAADGTLLVGVPAPEDGLPALEVDEVPPAGRLGGEPLEQALVAGAAPDPLRPLIERIDHTEEDGVEITLRGGIPVRFGSASDAEQKWAAAAAVLADPKLDAVTYVDVRVPERPAAGGAANPLQSA
jgi:cell division protein FtsQ